MDLDEDTESSSDANYIESSSGDNSDNFNKATKYKFKRSRDSCLKLQMNYLKPIAEILQEVVKGTTIFFSEDALCKTDFTINVEGVGYLTFPLTENRIQKLISVSVNGEIPGKKIKVNIKSKFSQVLQTIRSELGFSDSCNLEAQLHNMLIYGPGHFFDSPQDSETTTDMVGTLVIIVPSPHIGGNLIIQHGTKEHIFVSENLMSRSFKCIGFYVDCKHKIEKVREGIRAALTYKLILKSSDNTPTPYVNRNLKNAIQNYFDKCQNNIFQNKFVYLLDHSYTEHSLKWNMLKGEDNKKGNLLLAIAKSLDLVPYLALIEIQYIWENLHKYRHHCANPIPIELDQVNYHLLHFINSNNEKQPFDDHCEAREKEICWTKETTTSFQHYSSYCEGFTGDGLNLDYWYKRGAVVLWPSSMKDQVNFKLNYEVALKELQAKIEIPWNGKEVCEIVKKCSKYLCRKENFTTLVKIALYIKDKDVSMSILSHFKWEIFHYKNDIFFGNAKRFVKLDLQYGSIWCIDLLNKWKCNETNCIYEVSSFIYTFVDYNGSKEVVQMIMNEQICKISSQTIKQNSPDEMEKYFEMVCDFFVSCAIIKSSEFIDKVMSFVISNPLIFTNRNLMELFLKLKKALVDSFSNDEDGIFYDKPLKTYIETRFGNEIANVTKMDDWSIQKQLNCQCKHCKEVNAFLLSKTEKKLELKLPQLYREHVEYNYKSLDLPVSFTVNSRKGIEKLIFLKSEAMHLEKCTQLKLYLEQIQ